MSNVVHIPERRDSDHPDIDAEARTWVITLDGDAPSDATLREFRAWLMRSPRHRESFRNAATVWGDLDQWSRFLYPEAEPNGLPSMSPGIPLRRWRVRPAAVVATLIVLAVSVGLVLVPDRGLLDTEPFTADYGSATGEVKAVTLPDGSDVRLNTRSKIAVSYGRSARVVHLTEGEAYFQVAHDPEHPFVVYAGRYAVEAIGTAFSVQRLAGGLEVNVTDGRVQVAVLPESVPDNAKPDVEAMGKAVSIVPFTKGQRAILKDDQAELELVQTVSDEDMEVNLAWRNGLLIFDNDPLEEVVAEISRYTPIRIVIADAGIRDLRIGGYFRVNDVPAILTTMEKGFGLHVEQVDNKLIYLSRQPGIQPAR